MRDRTLLVEELARRLAAPQRHRLLQGYPMVPLMRRAVQSAKVKEPRPALPRDDSGADRDSPQETARLQTLWREIDGRLFENEAGSEPAYLTLDPQRPLIIGVIPHTTCNPKIKGCGFCTFGHDAYHKGTVEESVRRVRDEIEVRVKRLPSLAGRRVDAVYFGGGTANLTPAKDLRDLAKTLARHFDLGGAEVTLEGVPSLFRTLLSGPFDVLLDMPVRHRRISMGVQTFDAVQIKRMGRQQFGDQQTVARVVQKAHRHGLTASGDFLFNLPYQTRAQMLDDVRTAVELGLDQICIYHLVLHPDQGTPWARDPALVAALPTPEQGADNWLALRESLLSQGFVQTTLTNFERAEVNASERRFVYEECSFTPETYDALGFGPLAITTVSNLAERRALKFLRSRQPDETARYGFGMRDLYFPYAEQDLKLLLLTRSLSRLRVERETYRTLFGADLADDFAGALAALVEAGLATLDSRALALSPRGMFYADAVAGLLASPRADELRSVAAGRHTKDVLHETLYYSMG